MEPTSAHHYGKALLLSFVFLLLALVALSVYNGLVKNESAEGNGALHLERPAIGNSSETERAIVGGGNLLAGVIPLTTSCR